MKKITLIILVYLITSTNCKAANLFDNADEKLEIQKYNAQVQDSFNSISKTLNQIDSLQATMTVSSKYNEIKSSCAEYEKLYQSANEGNAEDQYVLSLLYFEGICSEKDSKKALEFMEQSADNGYILAIKDVARAYYSGEVVEQNTNKAIQYLEKGDKINDPESQQLLAEIYLDAKNIVKDFKKSEEYFIKSYDNGNKEASVILAGNYIKGAFGNTDYNKAYKWALKGAENNLQQAYYLLSAMTYDPTYKVDAVESLKWAYLSAQGTNEKISEEAKKRITIFEKNFTSEQILVAQKLSKKWINKFDITANIEDENPLPNINGVSIENLNQESARALLLNNNIKLTSKNFGKSVSENNLKVFKVFEIAGADISMPIPTNWYATPLLIAVDYNSKEVFDYLINKVDKKSIDSKNQSGFTALHRAVAHRRIEMIDKLLERGADVNNQSVGLINESILSYAISDKDEDELVKKLLDAGAKPNTFGSTGNTPAISAISAGAPKSLSLLIKAGADLNKVKEKNTIINALKDTKSNLPEIIAVIKQSNYQPTKQLKCEDLFYSIFKNNGVLSNYFINNANDVDCKFTDTGSTVPTNEQSNAELMDIARNEGTPLFLAIYKDNLATVKEILKHNPSLTHKVSILGKKLNALEYAKIKNNKFIIQNIEEVSKKPWNRLKALKSSLFNN